MITVLLADDHTIVRQGLCALLKAEADIKVIGEAANGREAVALTAELSPQVLVMDISMPLLNGMEATRQILQAHSATKIIILSGHSDDAYVERFIALGAAGYLIKQSAASILPAAIREVKKGNLFLSPSIAHRRKDNANKARIRDEPVGAPLTPREAEVLRPARRRPVVAARARRKRHA